MSRSFGQIRQMIATALQPYKAQLQVEKRGSGIIASLLYRFENQSSHHIDILVKEAASELRDIEPDPTKITDDQINKIIEKYKVKAEKMVHQVKIQRPGGLG